MEFITANYIDTTTSVGVDSNTITVEYLLFKDRTFQYRSLDYDNDLTTTTITLSFDETQSVGRILLIENNFRDFTIYYNGTTANTFVLTNPTTTSDWSSNSETSLYLNVTPVNCTSVSIDITKTITADQEKSIGYVHISDSLLSFDLIPSAKNYKPILDPKQRKHELSDGGTRIQNVSQKWSHDIKFQYIEETFKDNLETVWNLQSEFVFIPFETGTSWDTVCPEVVWPGNFEFYKYSDNAVSAGFSGRIRLNETPW